LITGQNKTQFVVLNFGKCIPTLKTRRNQNRTKEMKRNIISDANVPFQVAAGDAAALDSTAAVVANVTRFEAAAVLLGRCGPVVVEIAKRKSVESNTHSGAWFCSSFSRKVEKSSKRTRV
jgi:hypothetical protein